MSPLLLSRFSRFCWGDFGVECPSGTPGAGGSAGGTPGDCGSDMSEDTPDFLRTVTPEADHYLS